MSSQVEPLESLQQWWQTPLGETVLLAENSAIASQANLLIGQEQIQIGVETLLLPAARDGIHQWRMEVDLMGHAEEIPFQSHSIDVVCLAHVLEFATEPHQVLREADRVLVADGVMVLCQFNPWSAWGLRRSWPWRKQPPWNGLFFSRRRLKDWLGLLEFDVLSVQGVMFRPPCKSAGWLARLAFLERWGKRLPLFSGASVIVAKKRTIPLTPIMARKRWKAAALLPPRVSQPLGKTNKLSREE
jgi:SAM-dependent methyltransferase